MSMSKYMHPRNIYKTPPNFKQLAIDYPEFRKHVKQELTGKVSLDFKDLNALQALTRTLLLKDFGLNVEIPLNKLIPTVPLRLNYILWIEDLMEICKKEKGDDVVGIDVGTGATCVYPLIAAKQYGWKMIATEVDAESLKWATDNVTRNRLNDLIQVKSVNGDSLLMEALGDSTCDFCMCNPPFFASQQETIFEFKSRKQSRPRPKNAFCGAQTELVAKGGEVEFVSKLIKESKELHGKIRIYSSMLGHKTSLAPLKKLLRDVDVISFKQTDFCQGNTTRWGLAWTFCDIDLRKVPEATLAAARKQKVKNPAHHILTPELNINVEDVGVKIEEIFNRLQVDFKQIKKSKNVLAYNITAHTNTWSHQRRKRRELMRVHLNKSDSSEGSTTIESDQCSMDNNNQMDIKMGTSPNVDRTADLISEMQVKSPGKRELEDDEGYYNNKKIKLSDEGLADDIERVYLESTAVIRKDGKGVHFELLWGDGVAGKDCLQQILQYVKNNIKL